jgi:hypothetical protein
MPSSKQMEKLAAAAAVRGNVPPVPTPGPGDEMPPDYWQAVLDDPRADAGPRTTGPSVRTLRLSEIPLHILRISCHRCARIVEIQKADAVRLAGAQPRCGTVGNKDIVQSDLEGHRHDRKAAHKAQDHLEERLVKEAQQFKEAAQRERPGSMAANFFGGAPDRPRRRPT